ncbi:Zn-dependent hydrolase, glyoxylase [metagenome]|uniref:Zn-dependent hydrolase, glyoxylase n=1 Tax=metagenome TaxID=256318 RepID=A0A2P2C5S4_9ZZZZ
MTYTGNVQPGGSPDTRDLAHLSITKVAVDPTMSNNCYLLTCRTTGSRVLIDAADDPDTLLALIGPSLDTVVTTHQHWDHHRALPAVVAATGATTVAGEPDAAAIEEQTGLVIDRRVGTGDTVAVGECTLSVIPIAGHTPGSICLRYDDPDGHAHLFTGDSLFPGGPGRTTTPEDFDSLLADLQSKVFDRLPDETWFYPGHGDDSTIGAERGSIPEWLERRW